MGETNSLRKKRNQPNPQQLHSVTLKSKSLGKIADDGDGSEGNNKLEI